MNGNATGAKPWPAAFALIAAIACADSSGPGRSDDVGIRVVSPADIRDTVFTALAEPLEVEVRGDDGLIVPGAVVAFSALRTVRVPTAPSVYLGATGSSGYRDPTLDTTDARGRASTRVLLGEIAGPGGVVVTVPSLSLTDTVPMTILPGRIVAFRVEPRDTAMLDRQDVLVGLFDEILADGKLRLVARRDIQEVDSGDVCKDLCIQRVRAA